MHKQLPPPSPLEDRGDSDRDEQFVALIASTQAMLRGYVSYLVFDRNAADDLLQEVNLVLWRRRRDYDITKPFSAWARGVARMQVLAAAKKKSDERILFDSATVECLAEDGDAVFADFDEHRRVIEDCLEKLPESQFDVVRRRYFGERSVSQIAAKSGRTRDAIAMILYRARLSLRHCLDLSLKQAAGGAR